MDLGLHRKIYLKNHGKKNPLYFSEIFWKDNHE